MHLYIWARGIKGEYERFLNELSAKYLPFQFHGVGYMVQVSVRYAQPFIEIVFPREHLSSMINSLGGMKELEGQESVQFIKKYLWFIRKIMGLTPIENIDEKAPVFPVYHLNVEILGIGIKEDKNMEDGTEAL